jgi:hypothetical protein
LLRVVVEELYVSQSKVDGAIQDGTFYETLSDALEGHCMI